MPGQAPFVLPACPWHSTRGLSWWGAGRAELRPALQAVSLRTAPWERHPLPPSGQGQKRRAILPRPKTPCPAPTACVPLAGPRVMDYARQGARHKAFLMGSEGALTGIMKFK